MMASDDPNRHECPDCGTQFDTAHGVKIHRGHMRGKLSHERKEPVVGDDPTQTETDRRFSWHTYEGPGPCNWQADDGRYCGAPEGHQWHRR